MTAADSTRAFSVSRHAPVWYSWPEMSSIPLPPLTIAGELVNMVPPGGQGLRFEGGLVIGTGEFTVQAFGYYGNQSGFSSMFIFGDIAYDFGGPPAFFVTGLIRNERRSARPLPDAVIRQDDILLLEGIHAFAAGAASNCTASAS